MSVKDKNINIKSSCLIGRLQGKLLLDDSYVSTLLLAPTGFGKGVTSIIPNLLYIKDSVIIYDVRSENFELTHEYREKNLGQKIYRLNFDDNEKYKNTNHYNPLDLVFEEYKKNCSDELNNILEILVPNEYGFYSMEAKNLIKAVIYFITSSETEEKNLANVFDIICSEDLYYYLNKAKNNYDNNSFEYNIINSFLEKEANHKNIIKEIAISALELWKEPLIREITSYSDFNVDDFRKEASTLYVESKPKVSSKNDILSQIIFNQFSNVLTKRNIECDSEYGIVLILDEFLRLGNVSFLNNIVPYARIYKLKIILVCDNISMIEAKCDKELTNRIINNCGIKIIFRTNDFDTAKYLSKILGYRKDEKDNYEPIFKPENIMSLPANKGIYQNDHSDVANIYERIFYYNDKEFIGKAKTE